MTDDCPPWPHTHAADHFERADVPRPIEPVQELERSVVPGTHYEHEFADAERANVTVSFDDHGDVELRIEGQLNGHRGSLWIKRSDLLKALADGKPA